MDTTTPLGGGGNGRGMLVGRYALRGLVGQGGMADVELAEDLVLDRQIAVKILHARYADDPNFLARFRREAQAAASLNHPNIVAVYDTGEQDGRPFIVMEYVSGQSLRDLMRREGIMPQRAAEIVGDAALGLHYAHERGLVHRDIKPANILLSDEGVVKVADFGIARAVSAESVTQTAAVFGTAAYVAPEQAQGDVVDRRTDIYALGCVLYEMLAGRQPFAAESAVALAYKHVSEAPIPPSRINPEITPQLEAVVMKAMAKSPEGRYQTARDFQQDLARALAGMAVAAPPAAAYATTQMLGDGNSTLLAASAALEDDYEPDEFEEEEPSRRRRDIGAIILGLLIVAILVVAGFLLYNLLSSEPEAPPQVNIPDVRNMSIDQAEQRIRDDGLVPQRVDPPEETPGLEAGQVIDTDPEPGTLVEEGSTVQIRYSAGPPQVQVPDVAGQPQPEAEAALQDAELEVGEVTEEPSDDVEAGLVIHSDPPAGTEVDQDSTVDLVVSTGPESLPMPNVQGLPEDQAQQQLREFCGEPICLAVNTAAQFSNEVGEGRVISQEPAPGTEVMRGDTVTIVISQGPEPTPTPTPTETPTETETPTADPTETETETEDDEDEDGEGGLLGGGQ
ncbi:MAG: Stk1 family PASTA domain-containing Ser/Thr kinase [Nitriliruptorales bacterium]|nr:Stk1 family PASTA domain-containing Ser/Thr kinase [Nitriliruptorales bacterium]